MSQPPPTAQTLLDGRCPNCGYALRGLPTIGRCPECGVPYDPRSASRLMPWPSALQICLRLGWPIAGLLGAVGILAASRQPGSGALAVQGSILGWAMMVALAINSYFQVRSMLKQSLPERIRTRGMIAGLRYVGATICLIIVVGFCGLPLAVFIGALAAFTSCLKSGGH